MSCASIRACGCQPAESASAPQRSAHLPHREAPKFLETGDTTTTMGEYLAANGFNTAFQHNYLLPMVAAVWSASSDDVLQFPAATLIRFCVNHSLLQLVDRPQWRTVANRSREYVARILAAPGLQGRVHLNTPVNSVKRTTHADGRVSVEVNYSTASEGGVEQCSAEFDAIIFACHPDITLRILGEDASEEEAAALGGMAYSSNTAYVHTDTAHMPARKVTWASWNYMGQGGDGEGAEPCTVTYWLNLLQNLPQHGRYHTPRQAAPTTRSHDDATVLGDAVACNPIAAQHPTFLPDGTTRVLPTDGTAPALRGSSDTDSVTSRASRVEERGGRPLGQPWIDQDVFVTLNPRVPPADGTVLGKVSYAHPQYTTASLAAQSDILRLQGTQSTWYAGAYLGYGFHEDAITSGLRAAHAATGVVPSWWEEGRQAAAKARAEAYAQLEASVARLSPGKGAVSAGDEDILEPSGPKLGAVDTVRLDIEGVNDTLFQAAAEEVGALRSPAASPTLREVLPPDDCCSVATRGLASALGCARRGGGERPIDAIAGAASQASTAVSVDSRRGAKAALPSLKARSVSAGELGDLKSAAALAGGYVDVVLGPRGEDYMALCPAFNRVDPWDPQFDEKIQVAWGGDGRSRDTAGRLHARHFPDAVDSDIPGHKAYVQRQAREHVLRVEAAATGKVAVPGDRPITQYVPPALTAQRQTKLTSEGTLPDTLPGATPVARATSAAGGGYTHMYTAEEGASDTHDRRSGPWAVLTGLCSSRALESLSTIVQYASASASNLAAHTLASPVLALLQSGVRRGCLVMRLPDNTEVLFGDPAARPPLRAHMLVTSWSFFFRVAAEADLGLARSYIAGQWAIDDLAAIFRIVLANRDMDECGRNALEGWADDAPVSTGALNQLKPGDLWTSWIGSTLNFLSFRLFMDNSIAGSRSNISAHYDLSNELFETFLDPETMAYSCGLWDTTKKADGTLALTGTLPQAQERKLDHIIRRAAIKPGDRVLDIGCGWAGMAIRIATTVPDTIVHGISLSKEQLAWGRRRVKALGLEDRITLEHVDYRTFAEHHAGEFDAVVSVEMIEAVGLNYLGEYMASIDRLLAPGGVACIQAITCPESRFEEYSTSTDFINTIIFPGGALPSLAALTEAMAKRTSLTVHSVENFAQHYARTLAAWYRNFNAVLPRVRALGFDDAFIRMWNYYFKYCEAGFAAQSLGLLILVFTRPSNPTLAVET